MNDAVRESLISAFEASIEASGSPRAAAEDLINAIEAKLDTFLQEGKDQAAVTAKMYEHHGAIKAYEEVADLLESIESPEEFIREIKARALKHCDELEAYAAMLRIQIQ